MKQVPFLTLALLLSTGLLAQKSVSGELTGDENLNSKGAPADEYTIQINKTRILNIWLNSDDFDASLIVESEDGTVYENDDAEWDNDNSYLSIIAAPGVYKIWAGVYKSEWEEFEEPEKEARGQYELLYERGSELNVITLQGRLDNNDQQLPKGEYLDIIDQTMNATGLFEIRVKGYGFSAYLYVESPSGKVYRSHAYDEVGGYARVTDITPEQGSWKLYVTSDYREDMGGYDLEIIDFGADSIKVNNAKPVNLE